MARLTIRIPCALTLAILVFPQASHATTMTFSGLADGSAPPGTPLPYVENGISATTTDTGTLGYSGTSGAAHLDDSGTSFTSGLSFTMAPRFDFASIGLIDFGDYTALFEGYRGGTLVADETLALDTTLTITDLGGGFVNLDEFRVTAVLLTGDCSPCNHFSIDNVTLQPVPLPAALPLLLTGIGTLLVAGAGLRARG